jgi:hypothetical protein
MSLTAADIARFMIAHLQEGRYGDVRILKPETARAMHARQFGFLSDMNGMALGFYEDSRNGLRIIGHGGDTALFHSDLRLIPEKGVGFFISLNCMGNGGVDVRSVTWHAFLDRYFPFTPLAAQVLPAASRDAAAVAGRYICTRRSVSTLLKVSTLFGEVAVCRNADGTISSPQFRGPDGTPIRFQETAPMRFQEVEGQARIGFARDADGRLVEVTDAPVFVFEKARWYEDSALHIPFAIGMIVVMALTLLLWPVGALLRRHYGRTLELSPRQRVLRLLGRLVPALDLLLLIAFQLLFSGGSSGAGVLSGRLDPLLRVFQVITWVAVAGTLVLLFNAVESWMRKGRWILSRMGDTLVALACLEFVWLVFCWNLLSGSLRY